MIRLFIAGICYWRFGIRYFNMIYCGARKTALFNISYGSWYDNVIYCCSAISPVTQVLYTFRNRHSWKAATSKSIGANVSDAIGNNCIVTSLNQRHIILSNDGITIIRARISGVFVIHNYTFQVDTARKCSFADGRQLATFSESDRSQVSTVTESFVADACHDVFIAIIIDNGLRDKHFTRVTTGTIVGYCCLTSRKIVIDAINYGGKCIDAGKQSQQR